MRGSNALLKESKGAYTVFRRFLTPLTVFWVGSAAPLVTGTLKLVGRAVTATPAALTPPQRFIYVYCADVDSPLDAGQLCV